MTVYTDSVSTEPLDNIRSNECESDVGSLCTRRFRALWNEIERLREALDRQCDNMAFVVNHVTLPDAYYEKFRREIEEDRGFLNPPASSPASSGAGSDR